MKNLFAWLMFMISMLSLKWASNLADKETNKKMEKSLYDSVTKHIKM